MKLTRAFFEIAKAKNRVVVVQGGTSAGKTFAILQLLIMKAIKHQGIVISVVSETMPHLKRGCIRDFINILTTAGIYSEADFDRTNHIYHFGASIIEFFSADKPDKMRGSRRDYLFINEANNVDFESYNQLEVRTRQQIFIDFNPVTEFWAHTDIVGNSRLDSCFLKFTFKDNDQLDQTIIDSIKARELTNPMWWRVYGLGEIGVLEGVIFDNWKSCDQIPDQAELLGFGIDFGYTLDPTTCVAFYKFNGEIYLDEVLYRHGLTNQDIYHKLKGKVKDSVVIADSAEPKSIEELYRMGMYIKPCKKGKDSILNGIDVLKRYQLHVTKDSTNLIKELRNYTWDKDLHGKFVQKPIDDFNHCIDAARYFAMEKLAETSSGWYIIQ